MDALDLVCSWIAPLAEDHLRPVAAVLFLAYEWPILDSELSEGWHSICCLKSWATWRCSVRS